MSPFLSEDPEIPAGPGDAAEMLEQMARRFRAAQSSITGIHALQRRVWPPRIEPLDFGAVGKHGTFDEAQPMPDDLTDAKIAAAEARTDAKLASFQGQFDVLAVKLDAIAKGIAEQRTEANSNRNTVVSTVVAIGFALAALLVTVVAYGDAIFSRGMSVRDVVNAAVQEVAKQNAGKMP